MPTENSLVPSSIFGRLSARSSLISSSDYKVSVQLLDDNEHIFQEFKKNANAQVILDYVCECLTVVETDYFGLRFQDLNKHRYWVDLNKPIGKQIRGPNIGLRFRVRFYPSDVTVLKDEVTRYQLFVQLQRDLLHGRLYCPQNEAAVLGALILQSVIGDFDPEVHTCGYVSQYKLLLKQTASLEEKIADAHKSFKGLSAAEAEMEFLKKASKLDTYGFDPYTVTDKRGQTMYVGVTHRGIFVYHISRMIHHITWDQLEKVDYLGKELYVTPIASYVSPYTTSPDEHNGTGIGVNSADLTLPQNGHVKSNVTKASALKFHCPSATFAKHLWRHILSQQAFFTENDAKHIKPRFSKPRIPLLSRGSTFRFPNSRVLHEIEAEGSGRREGPQRPFTRYTLPRLPQRQIVSQPMKYHTLPSSHLNNNCNATIPENEPLPESCDVCIMQPLAADNDDSIVTPLITPSAEMTSTTEHVNDDVDSDTTLNIDESLRSDLIVNPVLTSSPVINAEGDSIGVEGTAKIEVRTEPSPVITSPALAPRGVAVTAARIFFSCLLFLLIFSALAIAVFESGTTWLHSLPVVDAFRHSVYEPVRHFLLSNYERFGRH